MIERNVQHSVPVSEFLLRHGKCTHTPAAIFQTPPRSWKQILTRPLARTHKHAWRGKQTWNNMELLDSLYIKLQAGGVCVVCQ